MNFSYINSKIIDLYSPIPPIKSGTANYFLYALDEIITRNRGKKFNIVIDKRDYEENVPCKIKDCNIVDFRECDYTNHKILFIANNKWHKYCHGSLGRLNDSSDFSLVIHEPCCYMIVKELCMESYYPYSPEALSIINSIDLGNGYIGDYFLIKRKNIHYSCEYNTVGLHWNLNKAARIFVHSEFAATKISVDRNISRTRLSLYKHPKTLKEKTINNSDNKKSNKVLFGVFGWIQKSKQTKEIVKAFIDFLEKISVKNSASLYIIGEIADPVNYNPYDWVPKYLLENQNINIKGYLEDDSFNYLMSSMDAIISLRYPSCGETSGVVEKCNTLGIISIGNDYNAFSEETFDYTIPTEFGSQHTPLVNAMVEIYNKKTKKI